MSNRELDALVAEKVMGWTWNTSEENGFKWLASEEAHAQGFYGARKLDGEFDYFSTTLPSYSTSIAAAFEVVEKMDSMQWMFRTYNVKKAWIVEFEHDVHYGTFAAEAKTLPVAICTAALKALTAIAQETKKP